MAVRSPVSWDGRRKKQKRAPVPIMEQIAAQHRVMRGPRNQRRVIRSISSSIEQTRNSRQVTEDCRYCPDRALPRDLAQCCGTVPGRILENRRGWISEGACALAEAVCPVRQSQRNGFAQPVGGIASV
jgi:hypothetical protein